MTLLEPIFSSISTFDPAGRMPHWYGDPYPEKLYQGFVLGLLVSLEGQYEVHELGMVFDGKRAWVKKG